MAGHSKWANTKHRKAAQDAKRGKAFTKIIRELTTTARLGGKDINSNPRLRAAVDKALANNMARNTLIRAIDRSLKGDKDANIKTMIYEGYGPGGTAIIVKCLSDNRNRTVSEVRRTFIKAGGNLSIHGSVSYLFTKRGVISFAPGLNEDTIIEIALEAGADDVIKNKNGTIDIYIMPDIFVKVKDKIEKTGLMMSTSGIRLIPSTYVSLDVETVPKLLFLIKMLKNLHDVKEVYHNGEFSAR